MSNSDALLIGAGIVLALLAAVGIVALGEWLARKIERETGE